MIYFVSDPSAGCVKIGYSALPKSRFHQLQSGSSTELELLAVIDGGRGEEAAMQERFRHLWIRGEWFLRTGALAEMLAALPKPQRKASRGEGFWGMPTKDVVAATGVSEPMVRQIQNGQRRPSVEIALKLQETTGVSAIKLVFGERADEAF